MVWRKVSAVNNAPRGEGGTGRHCESTRRVGEGLRGTLFKRKGKLAFYQPIEVALYARCPPTATLAPTPNV